MAVTDAAAELHRRSTVVDAHTHGRDFVPQPARSLYRLLNRTTMPPDAGFEVLEAAGVDAVVAKAVGDPVVTRWYRGGAWRAVRKQLDDVATQALAAGVSVVTSASAVRQAVADGRRALVLGLEGADAVGTSVERVDELHDLGVRVVVPVHLSDNQLGTTCLPWQRYAGPLPVGRRGEPGLTPLGRAVVRRMQDVGIVVDVAHADHRTLLDIVDLTSAPVVSSHTGARSVADFERYLSDDELRALAATGGVVGLWPYRHRGRGVHDVDDLVRHAVHVASVVGPEHLCIGTDLNGVPGVMDGYRGEQDLPIVTAALLAGGFSEDEVAGVLGGNVLRVLEKVTG